MRKKKTYAMKRGGGVKPRMMKKRHGNVMLTSYDEKRW